MCGPSPHVKTSRTLVAYFPALRDCPTTDIPFRDVRLPRNHFGPCFRARGCGVRDGVEDVLVRRVQSKKSTQTTLCRRGRDLTYLAERSVDFPSTPGIGGTGIVLTASSGLSASPSGMGNTNMFVDVTIIT